MSEYQQLHYPWQRAVAVLRSILSIQGGLYASKSYEIPYERGVLFIDAEWVTKKQQEIKTPPPLPKNNRNGSIFSRQSSSLMKKQVQKPEGLNVIVRVKDVFSNTNTIGLEGILGYGSDIVLNEFNFGVWIDVLERVVNLVDVEGKYSASPIDDKYLFPEYDHLSVNLEFYPMVGGNNTRWREGSRNIQSDLLKLCRRSNYLDEKLRIQADYSRQGSVKSALISIVSPLPMPFMLNVFSIEITGVGFHVNVFRPGKWIFYLKDLAARS